jgi:hypothetical protein
VGIVSELQQLRRVRGIVVALVVCALTAAAAGKRVIVDPPVVRICPRSGAWSAIERCLAQQGSATITHSLPGARLVHVDPSSKPGTSSVAGTFGGPDHEYEVRGLTEVKVGKHVGHRIAISQVMHAQLSVDGRTMHAGIIRLERALYCGGDHWRCTDVVSSCDVLIDGRSMYSFRGTTSIADNQVKIEGARDRIGSYCSPPESIYLGWTDQ